MNFKRGLGLIETLVYVAIFTTIILVVFSSLFKIFEAFNAYRINRYINNSGILAMERITRDIRTAGNLVEGSSVFETNPGHLYLETFDIDLGATTTLEIFASSTQLMIKEGDDAPVILTPYEIHLENLIFRQVATSTNSKSKAVKIEMSLSGERGAYQKTVNFYNTVILRGTY